nr:RNA-directed DNA polymerase, eukaryota [Tanacetum cinerariifolium]
MVDGKWTEKPNNVKLEFLHHFRNRFDKPTDNRVHIDMNFPKSITIDQQMDLECAVSKDELKRAVWECDIPNGCNSCFIALISKVPDANLVKDFRPISLIGNGPFILNEVIQWCKLKKKQSLIFNVDFEKAYDSIRWDFLDDVLKKFGFGNKWCAWIQSCLRSSRGLRINMCKSKIMRVNVGDEKVKSAASKLGCLILNTPFSYLGTKVGENMSRVQLGWRLSIRHVGKVSKAGSRSCWMNIVNEERILSNQGIKVLDYMRIKLGNGESTAFWDDNWIGGNVLKYSFPCIYALETDKGVTVNSKMSDTRLENSLRHNIRGEGSGEFSVASIRKIIDDNRLSTMDTMTLWIKYVPIKLSVLAWKIKIEALSTRFNISRKGIDIDSIICPICECGVESVRHVFFSCSLVRQIVRKVCSWWDVMYIDVNSYVEWFIWMNSLRLKSKSKLMIECVFYVVWCHVWPFRNKLLFEDKKPSKAIIFDDVVSRSYYW